RSSAWAWVGENDIAECIRKPLAVFRRADLGPQRFDPEPTAVVEARKQGFVPLRELTGVADDLGPLWPSEHSLWEEQLGPAFGEDEYDGVLDRLLVRSPWPSLRSRRRSMRSGAGSTRLHHPPRGPLPLRHHSSLTSSG